MFTARISDGKKPGKLFSGKQAVHIMKKAAIDAKKGKGAFRLELSENGRLCVVAFGKTAVEAASYGAEIHRKGVRGRQALVNRKPRVASATPACNKEKWEPAWRRWKMHTSKDDLKIKELLYKNMQKSILFHERSELIALFEVEHEGQHGLLLYEATIDIEEGTDSVCYCNIESVTKDTIDNDSVVSDALNIDIWKMESYVRMKDDIKELIAKLHDEPVE